MEIYATEEQQLQAVKGIVQRYWIAIVAAVVVIFAAAIGWTLYQQHQAEQAQQASVEFSQLLANDGKDADAEALNQFISEHQGAKNYPVMMGLIAANKEVAQQQYKEAAETLKTVAALAEEPLKSIAQLRLARIQLQLKQYDAALASLTSVKDEAFKGAVATVRGDIYVAKGNPGEARNAYQQALTSKVGAGPAIQQKLDNLVGE